MLKINMEERIMDRALQMKTAKLSTLLNPCSKLEASFAAKVM